MSLKKEHHLKVIISILMALIGAGIAFSTEIKITSWPFAVVTFILIGVAFTLIDFHGRLASRGRFATEFDLDNVLIYGIKEVVNLKNGTTLFVLESNINYKTQVVEEPYGGFKKFDVIEGKYIVPKKFKAKLVEGRLLSPVQ